MEQERTNRNCPLWGTETCARLNMRACRGCPAEEKDAREADAMYDDIGSDLRIKQLREEKKELFEQLEVFYRVFMLTDMDELIKALGQDLDSMEAFLSSDEYYDEDGESEDGEESEDE